MRLGLLSTARINELLVAGARQAHGIEVVAIGSRERGRAEAQAQALGVPRAHDSYEALLADADVEAVYIALPNSLHVEWSLRALQAGRHVLCEKPLSRHPDDVARAYDAAEREGLVLAEGFMWRHHPQARRLVELLREIGGLRLIRASFSFLLERPEDVRLQAALDGGALMDVGQRVIHANDSVVAYVPHAGRWAYEVHVVLRRHRASLLDCEPPELRELSVALQALVRGYDALFERPFPYVMVVHQAPTVGGADPARSRGHVHVEFYPPLRTAEKLKYLAGSEQGAGTFISDTLPEESALALREAIARAS